MQRFVFAAVLVVAAAAVVLLACARPSEAGPPDDPERLAMVGPPAPATLPAGPGAVALPAANPYIYSEIAERAVQSVVNISTTRSYKISRRGSGPFFHDPFFRQFDDYFKRGQRRQHPRRHRQNSLGSGVIVAANGIVLTNNHVVAKADRIQVKTHDGREFDVEVIGTDPKTDLAVLRLKGKVDKLKALPLADSDKVRLGEVVLAVGNPFGLSKTVTMGIVSAKGRADMGIVDYEDFIQTDAAINPGNSGGALVNLKGQLLGINTAIFSRSGGYQGIGFAIPANLARQVMGSLLADGKVDRGWLGVVIQNMDADLQKAFKTGGKKGVLIGDVAGKSPAAKAGIQRGDVILRFDGKVVQSTSRLRNLVAMRGSRAKVKIDLLRKGKGLTVSATLAAVPGQSRKRIARSGDDTPRRLGLAVDDLDRHHRRQFRLDSSVKSGAVIVQVDRDSPAASAGLRPGDVIVEVNGRAVAGGQAFIDAVRKKNKVLLRIRRGKTSQFAMLRR